MSSIDEKRVYAERDDPTDAYLASDVGVVRVRVAADLVGEFGLVRRCSARDVAAGAGRLAVATAEDVLLGTLADDEQFDPAGLGPARTASFDGETPIAALDDGRVYRKGGDGWTAVGEVDAPVERADGALLATAAGVVRVDAGGVTDLGLADVRDVADGGRGDGAPGPLAATADGVFEYDGEAWAREFDGDARVVSVAGDRAYCATPDALYERRGDRRRDGEWRDANCPATGLADAGGGEATIAVTSDGTVLADAGDGWRSRSLGVPGVRAMAVRA